MQRKWSEFVGGLSRPDVSAGWKSLELRLQANFRFYKANYIVIITILSAYRLCVAPPCPLACMRALRACSSSHAVTWLPTYVLVPASPTGGFCSPSLSLVPRMGTCSTCARCLWS